MDATKLARQLRDGNWLRAAAHLAMAIEDEGLPLIRKDRGGRELRIRPAGPTEPGYPGLVAFEWFGYREGSVVATERHLELRRPPAKMGRPRHGDEPKVTRNIALDPALLRQAERLAKRDGVTVGVLVNEALRALLRVRG